MSETIEVKIYPRAKILEPESNGPVEHSQIHLWEYPTGVWHAMIVGLGQVVDNQVYFNGRHIVAKSTGSKSIPSTTVLRSVLSSIQGEPTHLVSYAQNDITTRTVTLL